jgi:hypothetical protein
VKAVDLAIVKALLNRYIPHVVDGNDGVDGLMGLQGPQGASGKTGEVGKQGLSGKDGKDAVNGLNGTDGLSGLNGTDGLDGEQGLQGAVGKAGSDGTDGERGPQGEVGPKGDKGDTGKGIASIKVNAEDMLVITFDDGDMTVAGKMHFTKETSGGSGYYTGAPVGSFGITGTKLNAASELIIIGAWGKEFNTGFVKKPSGIAELDFGTGSKTTEVVVTGVSEMRAYSPVFHSVLIEETEDHSVDDLLVDPIRIAIRSNVVGVGFTIYGEMDNAPANGKYKVQWALV